MASPEYLTMVRCTTQLTDTIAGDPKRVAESLFAEGYIAPALLDDMQMDTMRSRDKASKLVSSISDRIRNKPSTFHEFVRLLKEQGPWTKDLIESLNTTYSSYTDSEPKVKAKMEHRQENQEHHQWKQEHRQENQEHSQGKQEHSQGKQDHRQENQEHNQGKQDHCQENRERHQEDHPPSEESEGEIDECSFLAEHRDLLTENLVPLCDKMEPLKVVTQLRKQGVFQQYDREIVLGYTTSRERNEKIFDLLYTRGPEAFDKFINCLKSINSQHSKLAYTLQPVRYRILWFASSPSQAAAVVYVLEKYGKAKFLDITNRTVDSKYIVRRATIFQRVIKSSDDGVVDNLDDVKYANEVEVCLVFPICSKDEFVNHAMSASFEHVCPEADVVVMSGVCVGVRGGVAKEGDLVFVDRATQPPSSEVSPCSDFIKIARERIQRLFTDHTNQPIWMKELYSIPAASSHAERAHLKMPHFETVGTSSSILETQHPKLDCVDDPPYSLGRDIDTHNFFSLCQSSLIQGKPQFVCKGVLGVGECVRDCDTDVAMSCTVRSSCVLMEVCRLFVERFRTAANN